MGCDVPLLYEVIQIIFSLKPENEKRNMRFQKQLCEMFSTSNRSYQICPGADCANCIKSEDYNTTTVKCTCGKVFCFRCSNDDHSPCTCE